MVVDYKKEDKIAIFTLNRPEALNSISIESLQELSRALIDFKDDDNLLVGIITGAGEKAFSIGADIETLLPELKKTDGQIRTEPPNIMRGLNLWKPMIAAINGATLGGGLEIALACDLRIASENAIFGAPEVTLGIIPGWGGTQRLPRVIPLSKATELILTGRPISAQEAYRIGLINKVVPLPELMSTAIQAAKIICRQAPLAVRAAKQAMIQGMNLSMDDGLKLEKSLNDFLVTTKDFDEGRKAFLEKRKASFKAE
jgi:enoyl-CoA hydratase/carnithine racemase